MSYDPDNIFAKILRGAVPCVPVCEDSLTLAFMDAMPQGDGHVLVVPKEPAATIFELSDKAAVACIRTVQRVAVAVRAALGTDQVFIMQLNGALAGQTVHHLHFHVIPRYPGVPLKEHARVPAERAHLVSLAEKISQAIKRDSTASERRP